MRSQEQRRSLNAAIANSFEQLNARHAGHRNIEDETIESSRDGGFECRHAAVALFHLKAQPAKVLGQEKSHIGIVICDEKTFTRVLGVWCCLCQMSDPVGGDLNLITRSF